MKKNLLMVSAVLLALVFVFSCGDEMVLDQAGPDISFTVTDASGNPVENVEIGQKLSGFGIDGDASVTTDAAGTAVLTEVFYSLDNRTTVIIIADGYDGDGFTEFTLTADEVGKDNISRAVKLD